jgi:hypothetical protein
LENDPIICFDRFETLVQKLIDLNQESFSKNIQKSDFIDGTLCINETLSSKLKSWGLRWSFTTTFYKADNLLSTIIGRRIELTTKLEMKYGGKFQITSYPYKTEFR